MKTDQPFQQLKLPLPDERRARLKVNTEREFDRWRRRAEELRDRTRRREPRS